MPKRISISLEPDDAIILDQLKREEFYDKSWAELYRALIAEGIKAKTKKKGK